MSSDKGIEKEIKSTIDVSYSKFLESKYELQKKKVALDFLLSILSFSFAALGALISLFVTWEIKIIPKDYISLFATIISAGIGLAVVFVVARGTYKARQKRRELELKTLRDIEAELFKDLEHDLHGLINRSDTYAQ